MKNLIYLFLAGALALGSCSKDDPQPIAVGSVTLNKTTLTLAVGQETTLTATITPDNANDKSVTWRSSAPTIATVSDAGVVTAIAAGSATITATGGGKSASCAVTVEPVTVESITLDKTELILNPGESATLTATVLPADAADKTVVWSSDKPDVAAVDDHGVVTAIAAGSATITATAGGMMATCAVTVEPIAVESVTLDKTELTLKRGESETLTATVLPADATDKTVVWSSDKPDVATVDESGIVTGVKPGAATITATAGEKSATCAVTVEPNVYAVGYLSVVGSDPKSYLWKNGVATELPMLRASSVNVSEGDVYIGGRYENDNGQRGGGIWKNGTMTEFIAIDSEIYSICVSDGNVYAAGSSGGNKTAYLWENGVQKRMEDAAIPCAAYSVFVSGKDVYVAGDRKLPTYNNRAATYWKNGTATDLTDGAVYSTVKSIVVAKGVVYAAGYETIDGAPKAVLWTDGVKTYLPEGTYASGLAVSESGDFYVSGICVDNSVALWKNGQLTKLDKRGYARDVFVYGDDVYVVGDNFSNKAFSWKNGMRTELPGEVTFCPSVFVY